MFLSKQFKFKCSDVISIGIVKTFDRYSVIQRKLRVQFCVESNLYLKFISLAEETMPCINIKDYDWRQNSEFVILNVPIRGHPRKVDLFVIDNYAKVQVLS